MTNRHLLVDHNCYLNLYNIEDDFSLILGNIILKSILNKKAIEQAWLTKNDISDINIPNITSIKNIDLDELSLPHFISNGVKIYIPLFNRALNFIYSDEQEKLLSFPYVDLFKDFSNSIVSLFELYNFDLFDSNFTKLIKLSEDETTMAFYHLDFHNLYFINKQGGLDVKIALFDRYLKDPSYDYMTDRLMPIVSAYFNNDRNAFVRSLLESKLVSQTVIEQWWQTIRQFEQNRYR